MKRALLTLLAVVGCEPTIGDTSSGSTGSSGAVSTTSTYGTLDVPSGSGAIDGSTSTSTTGTSTSTAGQCGASDEPLETDGIITRSPCYTPESFTCSSCAAWCETAELGPCARVEVLDGCPPVGPPAPETTCDTPPTAEFFRCACDVACAIDPITLVCMCDGERSEPGLCGCFFDGGGECLCASMTDAVFEPYVCGWPCSDDGAGCSCGGEPAPSESCP